MSTADVIACTGDESMACVEGQVFLLPSPLTWQSLNLLALPDHLLYFRAIGVCDLGLWKTAFRGSPPLVNKMFIVAHSLTNVILNAKYVAVYRENHETVKIQIGSDQATPVLSQESGLCKITVHFTSWNKNPNLLTSRGSPCRVLYWPSTLATFVIRSTVHPKIYPTIKCFFFPRHIWRSNIRQVRCQRNMSQEWGPPPSICSPGAFDRGHYIQEAMLNCLLNIMKITADQVKVRKFSRTELS